MRRIVAVTLLVVGATAPSHGGPVEMRPEVIVGATAPDQYVPREVVVAEGWSVRFAGTDRVPHDLESFDTDELGLPLFSTGGPVRLGETAEVAGVPSLEPGPYLFLCNLHDGMTGRLVVLEVS